MCENTIGCAVYARPQHGRQQLYRCCSVEMHMMRPRVDFAVLILLVYNLFACGCGLEVVDIDLLSAYRGCMFCVAQDTRGMRQGRPLCALYRAMQCALRSRALDALP